MLVALLAQLPVGFGGRFLLGAQRSSLSDYNQMAEWINDNKSNFLGDAAASDYPYLHGTLDVEGEGYVKLGKLQAALLAGYLSASTHYKTQGTDNNGADYTYKEDWGFKAIPVGVTLYYNPALGLLVGAGVAYYMSTLDNYWAYTSADYGVSTSGRVRDMKAGGLGFHFRLGYVHRMGNLGLGAFFLGRYAKISGYKGKYTVSVGGDSRTEDVQLGFQEDQEYTGYIYADEGTDWQANQRDGVVDFSGVGLQLVLEVGLP